MSTIKSPSLSCKNISLPYEKAVQSYERVGRY